MSAGGRPSAGREGGSSPEGFEPWAHAGFGLAGLTALAFVLLGLRLGGRFPVFLHARGLLFLGLAAGVLMAFGLAWSVLRRPLLQRGRLQVFLALAASLWAASYPLAYPSSHAGHPSRVVFRLPFEETWTVVWGGEERENNVLVLDPWSRYGCAFAPPAGGPAPEVLAPATGRLLEAGEALILEVAPHEFLVFEGLAAGGNPAPGGTVARGDVLGRLGSNHLRVYLQDRPDLRGGEGIPLRFHEYLADDRSVPRGIPERGERVRPSPAPAREPISKAPEAR